MDSAVKARGQQQLHGFALLTPAWFFSSRAFSRAQADERARGEGGNGRGAAGVTQAQCLDLGQKAACAVVTVLSSGHQIVQAPGQQCLSSDVHVGLNVWAFATKLLVR